MRLFHFHLSTPAGFERDEFGCEFETLEAAYLDAWTAALEISVDMLRRREDPTRYRFEVTDGDNQLLLELPFIEVLKPRAAPQMPGPEPGAQTTERFKRTRELQSQVNAGIKEARESLQTVRALLNRG